MRARRFLMLISIIALVLAACGGGGEATSTTDDATSTSESTGTPAGALVTDIEGAPAAVVRIQARGTFVDPVEGGYEAAGSGSGFIIDPSGIAVTNNHVVTGAGLLQVYVGDDQTTPHNARVLAVSECSDLAVIDIDGDGFPYLGWHQGEIRQGLEVFAAGFPLGVPEYTLTRGIVSKNDTVIESTWASVDHVIEHDARIRPGNSGGPLLTSEGTVVGVNYAGEDTYDFNFAISTQGAERLVETLRNGTDVDAIGINGSAYYNQSTGVSGVWVSSVKSGSPADLAKILPGDLITTMEGVSLSNDGSMAEYCDVIRSHTADDVLSIEVMRSDTSEFLKGQINGTPLEVSISFANELSGTTENSGSGGSGEYASYMSVMDDTGTIVASVPSEWSDINGEPYYDDNGYFYYDVTASRNLDDFWNSWTTPGVRVTASWDLAMTETTTSMLNALQDNYTGGCTYYGRESYQDPVFTGEYDIYINCGGSSTVVVLAAYPDDGSYIIIVQFLAVADRDFTALDEVLNTFNVLAG